MHYRKRELLLLQQLDVQMRLLDQAVPAYGEAWRRQEVVSSFFRSAPEKPARSSWCKSDTMKE
jgi:hypothetical protein